MDEAAPGPAVYPSYLESVAAPVDWSVTARHESWRKERHRPATYVHKWWARRLGSVTRGLLVAAVSPPGELASGRPDLLAGVTVYDPFAGAGTGLVEAAKLGASVIGRDLNAVATLTQRQAFNPWSFERLEKHFYDVAARCREEIETLHRTSDDEPVLHYFWVAVARCPDCREDVELFPSHVFAKHAYPRKVPTAHIVCPDCHSIAAVDLSRDTEGRCEPCGRAIIFEGVSRGRFMRCRNGHRRQVIEAIREKPLRRQMYAKQVLAADGTRQYRPIEPFDRALYRRAGALLAEAGRGLVRPDGMLEDGASTAQAIRWGFTNWGLFFNDRQTYCLGLIGAALRDLPGGGAEREALIAAFGRTVEHHNVFCSYKGEGTGPVRSIFHNHVLRPERVTVEGDPWGSYGGSAGFSRVLDRLHQAHQYKRRPLDFGFGIGRVESQPGHSAPTERRVTRRWEEFTRSAGACLIGTGDAADSGLPDNSVDMIVTDPPYVDNVHYSELADFFHVWLRAMRPHPSYSTASSTRSDRELQNANPEDFQQTAERAWRECARVLKPGGVLVFSFHQSRSSGWSALMQSLQAGGFAVTATRAVVAEVATSLSKLASDEPNKIDVIVVCRPMGELPDRRFFPDPETAAAAARSEVERIDAAGLSLGAADIRTAVRAAVLACGTRTAEPAWDSLRETADRLAGEAAKAFYGKTHSPHLPSGDLR